MNDVVILINEQLWTLLGKYHPTTSTTSTSTTTTTTTTSFQIQPIYFKSGQTPLIYDPMSIISYGYASCTGLSILLINALRTFGIPSRLVGTPAWNGEVENGNHNWVEVWDVEDTKDWKFMEPTAGTEGVVTASSVNERKEGGGVVGGVDHMKKDPCKRWFCNGKRMDGYTRVYAARLEKSLGGEQEKEDSYYPMAWDSTNYNVQGEDRTEYYTDICSKC